MNRRDLLKGLPIAIAATSMPALASVPINSPRQRLDAAIAELKAAATEVYPDIQNWTVGEDGAKECPLLIAGLAKRGVAHG